MARRALLVWVFRVGIWVVPVAVLLLTRSICLGLLERERIERARELTTSESA